jgi:hypothetical protein
LNASLTSFSFFLQPKDSQHPDRDANLQVCIETWLTEEEYQEAKAQHMLAWQDESPPPAPSEHPEKLTLDILVWAISLS